MIITEEQKLLIKSAFDKPFSSNVANYLNEMGYGIEKTLTPGAVKNMFYRSQADQKIIKQLVDRSITVLEQRKSMNKMAKQKVNSLLK